jgi:hypothetical protein
LGSLGPLILGGDDSGAGHFEARTQTDNRQRLDNQPRLRQLVREHAEEVTVFSSHSAAEFRRLSQRSKV